MTTFTLCLISFVIGINLMGTALMPEKFPFIWQEYAAWVCFTAAFILWEIARK